MTEMARTARGRATRDRIVEIAAELIAERGVVEVSLDDILERAGVSKGQLYEGDEQARSELADSLVRWQRKVSDGLRSMQARGRLDPGADPDELATSTLAMIQGGLVLTQASRDPSQLRVALDAAYLQLRGHAVPARRAGRSVA